MKGSNSLRTQRFIAQYGKSARHPVCQAALTLWGLDAKLEEVTKETAQTEKIVNNAKQQKEQLRGLYEQFYKGKKQKEVIQAEELLRKIGEHLPKVQTHYEAGVKLSSMLRESRPVLVATFKRAYDAAIRTGRVQALRALQRVQKRWNNKKVCLGDSDRRTLEILKMIHDKVTKAVWVTKGEVRAGYLEAFLGGDRPLSDEVWQGRFTVREIHSRLITIGGSRLAGDKDGKEIRRTMSRLGIRPAEEQRGRKWKPPLPQKQEPKRPRGSPATKLELKFMGNLKVVEETNEAKAKGSPQAVIARWKEADRLGAAAARRVLAGIGTEIRRLTLLCGHSKSGPRPKHKPEGRTKGRSSAFADFLDAE